MIYTYNFKLVFNVFVSRQCNLKIWRSLNVGNEQKSLLILIILYLIFILYFPWDYYLVKPTILKKV